MTHDLPHIYARFVSDGSRVVIPERMGEPRDDQLQGTPGERLAELAGRVCYDSLGKGRASEEYHKHILEVGHLSVWEHVVFTVAITPYPTAWLPGGEFEREKMLPAFLNRPGVFVRLVDRHAIHVTLNVRAALEWSLWSVPPLTPWRCSIWDGIMRALAQICPVLTKFSPTFAAARAASLEELRRWNEQPLHPIAPVQTVLHTGARTIDEQWVSLFVSGSRGMSHELVRHGDFTAISQRSTRYVDEVETPWVEHPLITRFLRVDTQTQDPKRKHPLIVQAGEATHAARQVYAALVDELERRMIAHDVDKLSARKQARGAARGYLGNGLYTELIFSASVSQWRRMLQARCSDPADAEIREVFARALGEMPQSEFRASFGDLTLRAAYDGLGVVLRVEG